MGEKDSYVHILLDKDPGGPNGQEICDHCKLQLPEFLEDWEEFLNGEFVYGVPPQAEGYYPVHVPCKTEKVDEVAPTAEHPDLYRGNLFKVTVKQIILHARPALRKKNVFVWDDPKLGAKVVARWSLPIPYVWIEYIPFFRRSDP
jgi:hypothetical protein